MHHSALLLSSSLAEGTVELAEHMSPGTPGRVRHVFTDTGRQLHEHSTTISF